MKKIFIMLLLACSTITIANAQQPRKRTEAKSTTPICHVEELFKGIEAIFVSGEPHSAIYKNPNTGQLESREIIMHFVANTDGKNIDPSVIASAFKEDEPISYQLVHLLPGEEYAFQLKVPKDALRWNAWNIRTDPDQEMWFMAKKNPTNPQLRDAYAIVWRKVGDSQEPNKIEGDFYMITSLRPDLYERDMAISKSTFRLDGRVGYDLSDSLYVFYMADTYEKLNELTMMTDSYATLKEYMKTHSDVLPMPVDENHQFGVMIDIDKHTAGRIRTVMPDGSLCKLWTNIDMVPGETYRITTHNGYYDEDRDYEMRFGRHSAKSMFRGRENDDVELTGGYEDEWGGDTVAEWTEDDVIEDVVEDDVVYDGDVSPTVVQQNDPLAKLTEAQKIEFMQKVDAVDARHKFIKGLYEGIGKQNDKTIYQGGIHKKWENMDPFFKQITKENEKLDKQLDEFFKDVAKLGMPAIMLLNGYKESLGFFTKQNQGFNELYKKFGHLSDAAAKCQKALNKIIERRMKEMSKEMMLAQ